MKSIWIGLVHLRPDQDCWLNDQNDEPLKENGFVQIVAFVKDADEFAEQVKAAAEHYRMTVMGIEDLEPLNERLRKHTVDEELLDKAKEAEVTGYLRFGTFHCYPAE